MVPKNVLHLSVLGDFIFLKNTWKLWASEGVSLLLAISGLDLHTGWMNIVRMHIYDHWIDVHAQGVKGELYQSYSLHFFFFFSN